MSRRQYRRYGLAEVTWQPSEPKPPKMPPHVRLVLHELRRWQEQGRPFMNRRELAEACGLDEVTVGRSLNWLDRAGAINDRREPL